MRINDVNICIKIVNCSLDEIPDTVKGKVVYVNVGEYNPVGWFHDVVVNKEGANSIDYSIRTVFFRMKFRILRAGMNSHNVFLYIIRNSDFPMDSTNEFMLLGGGEAMNELN